MAPTPAPPTRAPINLGSGTSMVHREQIRRDLSLALAQSHKRGVPLVIGSAGIAGGEPFAEALAADADVVLAGRACDTAIYAALPISRGFDPALALHLAKIMECGAQSGLPFLPLRRAGWRGLRVPRLPPHAHGRSAQAFPLRPGACLMSATLQQLARVLRSKNAGPFQITIDLIFDAANYQRVLRSGVLDATTLRGSTR